MFEELARTLIRAARGAVCGALGSFYSLLYQALFDAYWLLVGWEDDTYRMIQAWRELSYIWPLSAVVDWVLDRLYSLVPYTVGAVTWMFDYPIAWLNRLYDDMFGDWELVAWVYFGFTQLETWAAGIGRALDSIIKDVWDWLIENVADLLDPIGWAVCEVETWLRFQDPTKPGYQWNYWNWYKIKSETIYDAFLLAFHGVAQGILERFQVLPDTILRWLGLAFEPLGWALEEFLQFITGLDYPYWSIYKAEHAYAWDALYWMAKSVPHNLWLWVQRTIFGITDDIWKLLLEVNNWVVAFRKELKDFLENPVLWMLGKIGEFITDRVEDFLDLVGNVLEQLWEPD